MNIQDIISAFYLFRGLPKEELLKKFSNYKIPMIYNDEGEFIFELQYVGQETINTYIGQKKCFVFKPILHGIGRIFRSPNAITIWVTNDEKRIPVRVKAKIVVGTIYADLVNILK